MKHSHIAALLLAVALSLGLALPAEAAPVNAKPTTQDLYLMESDGSKTHQVIKELPIYNIAHNNYMKIRDIGYLLDFQVEYDQNLKAVSILTNRHSDGKQVSHSFAEAPAAATPAWSKLYVDGTEVTGLTMYNIQGNNYIKLRDIAQAVGFGCIYSHPLKAVVLSPFFQYTPDDLMTNGQAIQRSYLDGTPNQSFYRNDLFREEALKPSKRLPTPPAVPAPHVYRNGEYLTIRDGEAYQAELAVGDFLFVNDRMELADQSSWKEWYKVEYCWEAKYNHTGIQALAPGFDTIKFMGCDENGDYQVVSYVDVTITEKDESSRPSEPGKPSKPVKPSPTTPDSSSADFTAQVAALVNQERAKVGIAPLHVENFLQEAASIRVKELPVAFSHTRPDGSSCFTVLKEVTSQRYRSLGENIAAGQQTPEAVMEAWMNSPGHRNNILNPQFTSIGVGYQQGNWVQLFWS